MSLICCSIWMFVQGVEYVSFMKLLEVHLAAIWGNVMYTRWKFFLVASQQKVLERLFAPSPVLLTWAPTRRNFSHIALAYVGRKGRSWRLWLKPKPLLKQQCINAVLSGRHNLWGYRWTQEILKNYRWACNQKFPRQKCRNCAFSRQNSVCLRSLLTMRSFAIDEPGLSVRALYATLQYLG